MSKVEKTEADENALSFERERSWEARRLAEADRKALIAPIVQTATELKENILAQVAIWQGRRVYAFTRAGDVAAQEFARSLGAVWAGGSEETPPEPLDAAIIFAPVGSLVPAALRAVKKGGRVVCGGIHMSDIPSFPYSILWEERQLRSVANLTREDAREFLAVAPKAGIHCEITRYPLEKANEALSDLRDGRLQGAAVLVP